MAREAAAAGGLPAIEVSALHGRLLAILALSVRARRVLEVGTLAGYSTIWLARALPPDGRLVTLEIDPRHAEVARANVTAAGVGHLVDLRLGPAAESLSDLEESGAGPFDLVFIDADKTNNPAYLEHALRLTATGSLIVVDNVVRGGDIVDASLATRPDVAATRALIERVGREPRVAATVLQTVGVKGHDGLLVAVVTGG
jgi:predicted O-methyltransferase YrrM